MTYWKELLSKVLPDGECHPPVSASIIVAFENSIQIEIPDDLRALLLETNGVTDREYGYAHLWSIERIVKEYSSDYSKINYNGNIVQILFFADAGNGDCFGFLFDQDKGAFSLKVYVWDHEDDSIRVIASTLTTFIKGWFSGKISI